MNKEELTILHVEDDASLADLVKTAFERFFGFQGSMINAISVSAAVSVLNERERKREPLSLIISDMQLPDGTGLDVIREVKTNPAWRMTPVIILSNEVSQGVINDAYALGANSYLPKTTASGNFLGSLQSLYPFWLENVVLPREESRDRLQEALERAIGIRNRTAEYYLSLAGAFEGAADEMAFWLDRALNEGNLSNLLAFFRTKVREMDMPRESVDRLVGMQIKVKDALQFSEDRLSANPAPSPVAAYQWVLELADALDEEVFAEVLGVLFPKSAVATTALKARAAAQMTRLATHIRERTADVDLRQKADALLAWSRRLMLDNAQRS